MAKQASPAQLAARAKFAARAKVGANAAKNKVPKAAKPKGK